MKIPAAITFIVPFILLLSAVLGDEPAACQNEPPRSIKQSQKLSPRQVAAITVAVEDEVYDYSQQKAFYQVGVTTKASKGTLTKIPLYIRPNVAADGLGEVIYKDMPYGEILRQFYMRPDGLVVLYNDPQLGFPQTQPSHLTVFMDDTELCQDKLRWIHGMLEIEDAPAKDMVIEAAKRQLNRVGFSDYLSKHATIQSK